VYFRSSSPAWASTLSVSQSAANAGIVHRLEAEGSELVADVVERHRFPVVLLPVLDLD
jgi:hypothetical protein